MLAGPIVTTLTSACGAMEAVVTAMRSCVVGSLSMSASSVRTLFSNTDAGGMPAG
jgi:hypothetical protein